MKIRKMIAIGAALCLAVGLSKPSYAVSDPEISADSAIVMDRITGTVLYEKNPDQRALIASTTKIMTGLLVCENMDPETVITVDAHACGIEGSSLYLKPGQQCTVGYLLYGMMLHSGNDAALALAIAVCGSEEAFVARMNQRAAELSLLDTHFANPHGLDDNANYSTARDLAALTAAALRNVQFSQVVSTERITLEETTFVNHNKLLGRYPGADGVKTGYTKAAGRILVSSATRNGRQLIAVTINAPDDWRDHTVLLDHGFAGYTAQTVIEQGTCLGTLPLAGDDSYVYVMAADAVAVDLRQNENSHIRILTPRFLYAPIRDGQVIGTAQIVLNQTVIGSCELVAKLP